MFELFNGIDEFTTAYVCDVSTTDVHPPGSGPGTGPGAGLRPKRDSPGGGRRVFRPDVRSREGGIAKTLRSGLFVAVDRRSAAMRVP